MLVLKNHLFKRYGSSEKRPLFLQDDLFFKTRDFLKEYDGNSDRGILITNPPYGVRLLDKKELAPLYLELGQVIEGMSGYSSYVITSYDDMEKIMGKKAAKNRKIYNGEIRTYFYSFPAGGKK